MILHNLRSGYREESMKKKILMIIVFVIVLFFGYKLITDSSDPNQNPATIPLCHILGHSYLTNDPRAELEDIENGYEFYGTIDKYREVYHVDDKSMRICLQIMKAILIRIFIIIKWMIKIFI